MCIAVPPLYFHCVCCEFRDDDWDSLIVKGDVDEEDSTVPDRQQDIKPRFHRAKTQTQRRSESNAEGVCALFRLCIKAC